MQREMAETCRGGDATENGDFQRGKVGLQGRKKVFSPAARENEGAMLMK